MDTKRFEELKSRAIQISYILDILTGDGAIIHKRNHHHELISRRLCRLEKKGEEVITRSTGRGPRLVYHTLDGLERRLDEANRFIAKVKGIGG